MSKASGYLHLCVDYPRHYNNLGGWLRIYQRQRYDQQQRPQQQQNQLEQQQQPIGKQESFYKEEEAYGGRNQKEQDISDSDVVCVICLSKIDRKGCSIDCNHKYHVSCIQRWYQKEKTCPICRKQITNFYGLTPVETASNTNQDKRKKQSRSKKASETKKVYIKQKQKNRNDQKFDQDIE